MIFGFMIYSLSLVDYSETYEKVKDKLIPVEMHLKSNSKDEFFKDVKDLKVLYQRNTFTSDSLKKQRIGKNGMGLFSKKESKVSQDTNENLQKIKDDIENDIEDLESKVKEKNERLRTIIEKIELSKKEYNEIVGKIIQSKKELRSNENSGVNTNNMRK